MSDDDVAARLYTAQTLYPQLLMHSRDAFANGLYAAAYYALAAALHCAETIGDAAHLAEVEVVAGEQIGWLDTHIPTHHLATAASAARGTQNVWAGLARQAHNLRRSVDLGLLQPPL